LSNIAEKPISVGNLDAVLSDTEFLKKLRGAMGLGNTLGKLEADYGGASSEQLETVTKIYNIPGPVLNKNLSNSYSYLCDYDYDRYSDSFILDRPGVYSITIKNEFLGGVAKSYNSSYLYWQVDYTFGPITISSPSSTSVEQFDYKTISLTSQHSVNLGEFRKNNTSFNVDTPTYETTYNDVYFFEQPITISFNQYFYIRLSSDSNYGVVLYEDGTTFNGGNLIFEIKPIVIF
jgi:hypothetical protein